jgi:hypothetical protein
MPRRLAVGAGAACSFSPPEARGCYVNVVERSRVGARVVATASALLLSGCFNYVQADLGSMSPGEQIRLEVAAQGISDLASISGNSGTSVAGMLVGVDAASIRVRVPVGFTVEGVTTRALGQDVVIPRNQISDVERRELNRPRTIGMVAGGVAALLGAVFAYGAVMDNPEIPVPNPPDEIRIPLLSVPVW